MEDGGAGRSFRKRFAKNVRTPSHRSERVFVDSPLAQKHHPRLNNITEVTFPLWRDFI
jgi:hypothetical protein